MLFRANCLSECLFSCYLNRFFVRIVLTIIIIFYCLLMTLFIDIFSIGLSTFSCFRYYYPCMITRVDDESNYFLLPH